MSEAFSLEDKHIGAYRLIKQIGAAGVGNVYFAGRADGRFEQQVALKRIKLGMRSVNPIASCKHIA